MIRTDMPRLGQYRAGELAEAPPHAVAHHGVADLLRNRDSEPDRRVAVAARADEQDEAGPRRASPAVRGKEFRAAGELADFRGV